MIKFPLGRLLADDRGAVAATVALSLVALIAAGGVAFDYARLAGLDTELQDGADQAALAAASQLDQTLGAMDRAKAAAQSLLANKTLLANDGNADAGNVTVPGVGITFYANKADAESGANPFTDTARYKEARFVRVAVAVRKALYALTPVVGALDSGNVGAAAVAGLGSAICKVPPLMICNPQETASNTNFDISGYNGRGIRLVAGGGGGAWGPGNFGYLESGLANGAAAVEYALGANTPPGNCLQLDSVTTKPGVQTSVTDAINARFDIFENGLTNSCDPSTGNCSPSVNSRKDVVHPQIAAGGKSLNCGFATGKDPWDLPTVPYAPNAVTRTQSPIPTNMGLPRDICHSVSNAGDCPAGRIGDGNWDRTMYFKVNYPAIGAGWQTNGSLTTWASAHGVADITKITRYQVYRWEIDTGQLAARLAYSKSGTDYYSYPSPQCAAGLGAGAAQLDRRLTSVAVVNCSAEGVSGSAKGIKVAKWVEVFFVEPSIKRGSLTDASDIYVEIERVTDAGGNGSTAGQVVRHDSPYLVK